MDQLSPKALQQGEGPNGPSQEEAQVCMGLTLCPAAENRSRYPGRPGEEDQERDDGVIARERTVLLHRGCDPLEDLGPHGEAQELALRADADRREPGGCQGE